MPRIRIIKRPETFAEINRDIAQVFFAGLVVGSIIDKSYNSINIMAGILLSLMFWTASLLTTRR